jgi:hypothetical protein
VRWIVIIEKHFDDDPIESGNFRHMPLFVLDLEINLRVSDWIFYGWSSPFLNLLY